MIQEEKERILRDFFTEKEIKDYKDMLERFEKYGKLVRATDKQKDILEKSVEISDGVLEKYPNLVDEKFPQILSNGYKYYSIYREYGAGLDLLPKDDVIRYRFYVNGRLISYIVKILDYMGEEVCNKLENVDSSRIYGVGGFVYDTKNDKQIPIMLSMSILWQKTTYGLYNSSLMKIDYESMNGDNVFYLENGKFIKSDEKIKGIK